MAYVYQVFWTDHARAPRSPEFALVECEFPTMADLFTHLAQGGMMAGAELDTHWGDAVGERVIHKRRPVMFTQSSVAKIVEPTWRIVEHEGVAVRQQAAE